MDITNTLKTVYGRATQYCVAKYGREPKEINIDQDGGVGVVFREYHNGIEEVEMYGLDVNFLTEDLDALYAARVERAEQRRKQQEEDDRLRKLRKEEQAKKERFNQFLRLKREFES